MISSRFLFACIFIFILVTCTVAAPQAYSSVNTSKSLSYLEILNISTTKSVITVSFPSGQIGYIHAPYRVNYDDETYAYGEAQVVPNDTKTEYTIHIDAAAEDKGLVSLNLYLTIEGTLNDFKSVSMTIIGDDEEEPLDLPIRDRPKNTFAQDCTPTVVRDPSDPSSSLITKLTLYQATFNDNRPITMQIQDLGSLDPSRIKITLAENAGCSVQDSIIESTYKPSVDQHNILTLTPSGGFYTLGFEITFACHGISFDASEAQSGLLQVISSARDSAVIMFITPFFRDIEPHATSIVYPNDALVKVDNIELYTGSFELRVDQISIAGQRAPIFTTTASYTAEDGENRTINIAPTPKYDVGTLLYSWDLSDLKLALRELVTVVVSFQIHIFYAEIPNATAIHMKVTDNTNTSWTFVDEHPVDRSNGWAKKLDITFSDSEDETIKSITEFTIKNTSEIGESATPMILFNTLSDDGVVPTIDITSTKCYMDDVPVYVTTPDNSTAIMSVGSDDSFPQTGDYVIHCLNFYVVFKSADDFKASRFHTILDIDDQYLSHLNVGLSQSYAALGGLDAQGKMAVISIPEIAALGATVTIPLPEHARLIDDVPRVAQQWHGIATVTFEVNGKPEKQTVHPDITMHIDPHGSIVFKYLASSTSGGVANPDTAMGSLDLVLFFKEDVLFTNQNILIETSSGTFLNNALTAAESPTPWAETAYLRVHKTKKSGELDRVLPQLVLEDILEPVSQFRIQVVNPLTLVDERASDVVLTVAYDASCYHDIDPDATDRNQLSVVLEGTNTLIITSKTPMSTTESSSSLVFLCHGIQLTATESNRFLDAGVMFTSFTHDGESSDASRWVLDSTVYPPYTDPNGIVEVSLLVTFLMTIMVSVLFIF